MEVYDIHNHTVFSHDGHQSVTELCRAAEKKGLSGIAVTDHCDIEYYIEHDVKKRVTSSVLETKSVKEKLAKAKSSLRLFTGVEIGEAIFNMDYSRDILSAQNYDVVIGSVHAVRSDDKRPFSQIDFTDYGDAKIRAYMTQYFLDLLETARLCDYDVLAHLTIPLRYICGKYGYSFNADDYSAVIDEILKTVIERSKCLEVNTSSATDGLCDIVPSEKIFARYKSLGGKYVSLGSDAHFSERVGHGLNAGIEGLVRCGFENCCFFENRNRVEYSLK